MTRSAAAIAAATPAGRDRYVDLLRVAAIGVVVAGHWLMAAVAVRPDGTVSAGNALAGVPAAQVATWLFQVMPLFFLVGGFAHAGALRSVRRRGGGYTDFVLVRTQRLLAPTAVFLAVWASVAVGFELAGAQTGLAKVAAHTVVQPLWFIGVYLGVTALAPVMWRLHRRYGPWVVVALALAAVVVEVLRFRYGMEPVAPLNVVFVWLAAHQLGYLYADGLLTRRVAGWFAGLGLSAVVVLTVVLAWYPVSMVGLPGERVSNMNPPTVALVAHNAWIVGAAVLLRAPVTRWLARPRVWAGVVLANSMVMTVFLWHLTALFVLAGLVWAAGVPMPASGSGQWWLTRPVWLALLVPLCALATLAFRTAERSRLAAGAVIGSGRVRATVAAVGAALAVAGVLAVALTGLDGLLAGRQATVVGVEVTAMGGLAMLVAGWGMVRAAGSDVQPALGLLGARPAAGSGVLAPADRPGAG